MGLPEIVTVNQFTCAVSDAAVEDLRCRLQHARFAEDLDNASWRYGTNGNYLHALVDYWLSEYDWRRWEAAINEFSHYRVDLDGIPVHFIREPGRGPAPIPLVLTHGWPWTFWDFHAMIRPLADPERFGGDPADAFDVIVPSLPGYGFSSPLRTSGLNVWKMGDLWLRLMRDVLGYDRFGAHGGDWGAILSAYLGHAHASHLYGVHLSMCTMVGAGYPTSRRDVRPEEYGPGEEHYAERMAARLSTTESHTAAALRDPQSLAFALNDSPIGLLAWLVERRRSWSDCDGDVERSFTRDFLLTSVSIYWFTQTIGSSMRIYAERTYLEPAHDREPQIEAPTAVAVFPADVLQLPRKFAERNSNLHRWTVMPRGGHYAAAECPAELVTDIREFFRSLR